MKNLSLHIERLEQQPLHDCDGGCTVCICGLKSNKDLEGI